jgi:AhpD family alkylhydroperoxidase
MMTSSMSAAFETFGREAPAHAAAWMEVTQRLGGACALDQRTRDLAYLAVLAATRMESGIPFHVQMAKAHGATRDEVVSAILLGLQPAGHAVIACLPAALAAYDA